MKIFYRFTVQTTVLITRNTLFRKKNFARKFWMKNCNEKFILYEKIAGCESLKE